MSFKSYAVQIQADGSLLLTDPQPLTFSGRNGLIARFTLAGGKGAEDTWRLCPGEVHALALPELQLGDRMIVFEQSEDASLEVLELQAINGLSGSSTEMMFSFGLLNVIRGEGPLCVKPAPGSKTYTEELALDGGRDDPKGNWRWKKPHLAIGGVMVGGAGVPRPMAGVAGRSV